MPPSTDTGPQLERNEGSCAAGSPGGSVQNVNVCGVPATLTSPVYMHDTEALAAAFVGGAAFPLSELPHPIAAAHSRTKNPLVIMTGSVRGSAGKVTPIVADIT
jgi:hypothetical protein